MNVLSDILCNTSPLILSSSYSGPLLSHDASVSKSFTKSGLLPAEKSFQLLDSLASLPDSVQVSNSSGMGNDIFHSTETAGPVSSNMIPSGFGVHPEDEHSAAFDSDAYHEDVPSWLANDLIKASENMSPSFLSPEIYPEGRNNMLEIGFPQDISSHEKSYSSVNSDCLPDCHTVENAASDFQASESLLLSSFTNLSVPQLSVSKTNRPVGKYSHSNGMSTDSPNSTTQSIISAMLPLSDQCDLSSQSQLLSLSSQFSTPHLGTATSDVDLSSTDASHHHPMSMMSDKLPQISLNQLDLALDDMHVIHSNFSDVQIPEKDPCGSYPEGPGIEPSLSLMSCSDGSLSNLNITPFTQPQDITEITRSLPQAVISSSDITPESPVDSTVTETHCYKCKYCSFLSLQRDQIQMHVQEHHFKAVENSALPQNPASNSFPNESSVFTTMLGGSLTVNSTLSVPASLQTNITVTEPACQTVPSSSSSVSGHVLPHSLNTEDKQFFCSQCDLDFTHLRTFEQHLSSVHSVKPTYFRLDPSRNKLTVDHTRIKGSVSGRICVMKPKSSTEAPNVNGLDQPSVLAPSPQREPSNNKVGNEIAKKATSKKATDNEVQHSPQRKVSSHKEYWQKKMKRELGSYICESKGCNVRFRALDNLEYHRKCHIAGSCKFACPECGQNFDYWGPTAGHLWRVHSTDIELYACDQCPFKTHSLSNLENIHKPIHQNQCIFLCDVCGKGFKNRKQLRNHRRIHAKQQPAEARKKFSCFICGCQFLEKKFLRLHLDGVHNKQKSYTCKYCGYAAGKSSTLSMHMRRHMGEKPFACDECSYRTADHNSLRRHKMQHSGVKPYQCRYCSYACIQASTYKVHMQKRHPEHSADEMFSCNLCSFKTLKQSSYNAHIADHELAKASQPDNSAMRMMPDSGRNAQDSQIFPLVEAVDISLSHGDRSVLAGAGKDV